MQLDPITRAVLDAMQEGVLIIDAQERIVYGNRAYVAFLEKEAGGPIGPIEGYPLRLLRPGARLPEVLAQKRPILHTPRQESEDIYFVNMYPIFDGAEVVGGLSVVTFWKDAFDFRAELERYEKRSRQVLRRVNKANSAHYTFDSIVAVSPRSAACRELASRLAQTDVTVLLQSESGTGKELYAQAIHNASPRSAGVFVAINCANFNANMLESELFGYTEGAFTGAKRGGKIGLFEAAAGGTLFLDEISEMDVGLQAKLLRALQERRIRPVWRRWRPTCASSPPATPICPAMWRRGNSAPTCSTASTPSPSTSRRCGSGERTSLLSAAACWTSCPASSSDVWS